MPAFSLLLQNSVYSSLLLDIVNFYTYIYNAVIKTFAKYVYYIIMTIDLVQAMYSCYNSGLLYTLMVLLFCV